MDYQAAPINWNDAVKANSDAEGELHRQQWELICIGYLHGVQQSGTIHVAGYYRDEWLTVKARGWLAGTDEHPIITDAGLAELAKYTFNEDIPHAHG